MKTETRREIVESDAVIRKRSFFSPAPIGSTLLVSILLLTTSCTVTEERVSETLKIEESIDHTPHQIDRLGRMEITNIYLEEYKVPYNQEDVFDIEDAHLKIYREPLQTNLNLFDEMDGQVDWAAEGELNPLTSFLLKDYLIVDISKPCTVDTESYLDIELSVMRGEPHTTCGGRTPNSRAADVMLTLAVNGPFRPTPRRTDGVEGPTKLSSNQFPYLASPN